MNLRIGALSATAAIAVSLAWAPQAQADGEWKAPDVTLLLGSDIFNSGQTNKPGPALNTTISNYWSKGACTYDPVTGAPSTDCDRLRFGLAMFRAPDDNGNNGTCTDPVAPITAPKEDGGGELTNGGTYQVSQMQTEAGNLYCSDPEQRTLGESMLAFRDHRFNNELGTNWPDRPQLTLHLIESLPQTSNTQQDQVRESLLAAHNLYEGNGGQHLSLPSWVMVSPNADGNAEVELFSGMLAAAGGTGKCCYKPAHDVLDASNPDDVYADCDPNSPLDASDPNGPTKALDMGVHLAQTDTSGAIIHNEAKLRADILAQNYSCTGTTKPAGPGGMKSGNFSDMKCHLQGSPCSGNAPDDPANLWPVFSCIQLRPQNIPADQLSVEYCGADIDPNDDKDNDGCVTLTPGNGIEWVDDDKNLFYVSDGDASMCKNVGSGDSWTNINCPNLNELCDLNDGSQCALGRFQCVNDQQVCERFPGNDSCDSSACGSESVHETGIVHPNVQFAVDRSGSMNHGDRWESATTVAKNLASWSYNGAGCEADGTNCDKLRMGVHFWDDKAFSVHPAQEDLTGAMMQQAFDDYGPSGGTDFHRAAQLLRDEAALTDTQNPNAGIFITDGEPNHAFTTREAVRLLCDLKKRPGSPVATYAVGYQDGNQQLNSLVAAAGGTGSCCFAGDDTCDTEPEVSPCEMYQYELDHGAAIVSLFDTWLDDNTSYHDEWVSITDWHASRNHTKSAYRTGTVADDLDMVDDMARFLYANETNSDPDNIDCSQNAGDSTSTSPGPFYRHIICEMQNTLSYVVRHRYDRGNDIAEDYDIDDSNNLNKVDDDSAFMAHDFVCTGAKQADDEDALYAELQAILSGMECTYPLSLLSDMESAPEFTDATKVKLYMPGLGTVVEVPNTGDADGQAAFESELCSQGIENCSNYADDGWSFANEGRTAVSLSPELCDLTKTDTVGKVTTQVCRICDPDLVGSSCDYVTCTPANPPANPTVGDGAFTSDGQMCVWNEFPCPQDPDETCSGWSKTGRCGAGTYACDDAGFAYCEQVRSAMPEICNGIDDDCDGSEDDLSNNPDDWSDSQMSLDDSTDATSDELEAWYCVNRDVCNCPGGADDPMFGSKSDDDELQSMIEGQNNYAKDNPGGHCQCGEGITAEGTPALEPTRTWAPANPSTEPQASCSAGGSNGSEGLGAVLVAALLGLVGWRRRS